jgi:thiol-disulfide isomerase/thioredoxin
MKKFVWVICVLLAASSASAQRGKNQKQTEKLPGVHGTVTGGAGKMIYLIKSVNNSETKLDSALISENGKFDLIPSKPLPFDYYNIVVDEIPVMFITDSTEVVSMTASADKFRTSAVWTGSPQTEFIQSLINELDPIVAKQQTFMQLANDANASAEERLEAKKKYNELATSAGTRLKEWIKQYESQPAALVALMSLPAGTELALYRNELALLKDKAGHTDLYAIVNKEADKAEKMLKQNLAQPQQSSSITKGALAPEISLPDPNGNIITLSSMKGKVVLIDFWASWCGPCRRENPNVVKAYEKYGPMGFEVLSVSLDTDKARWLQAITQDKLTWPGQVSDLKGWNSKASQDYGVHSIPFPVLIDQEGKVIAFGSDVRGPGLELLLDQLLKP